MSELADKPVVTEIPVGEIRFFGPLGQGSYGEVSMGRWKGRNVAVKRSHRPKNERYLLSEIETLSRLGHPNIVKLYGVSTKNPVLLVMECADQGSLYDALHDSDIVYSNETAISWLLQCAQGVEYMHSQRPKPMVHRDLKSSNLLLFNGGSTIKVCDFGTAREARKEMSIGRGTPASMAPEVFQSSSYTEKCDVYSWAILIWEVLARQLPFADMENESKIQRAVRLGSRPSRLRNCNMALDAMMIRCWQHDISLRPSMAEVEAEMRNILSSSMALFRQITVVGVNQQLALDRDDGSSIELSELADYLEFEELTMQRAIVKKNANRAFSNLMITSTLNPQLEHGMTTLKATRKLTHTCEILEPDREEHRLADLLVEDCRLKDKIDCLAIRRNIQMHVDNYLFVPYISIHEISKRTRALWFPVDLVP
ncbi:Mitogen-activated protein kinase kinase kinase 7 [Halotydeus destructor]|nr:Mitogen-activated protein kinase kinase kinase 7 [Halotydeus destructor]